MDLRIVKLRRLGLELDDAEKLVKGGLDTPAKIRQATNKAIQETGASTANVRARFKKG